MNIDQEARVGLAQLHLYLATRKAHEHDIAVMLANIPQDQAALIASQIEREASR